jgi:hypothetical protein
MKNWLNTAKDWLKKMAIITPDTPKPEPVRHRAFSLAWNKSPRKCARVRVCHSKHHRAIRRQKSLQRRAS